MRFDSQAQVRLPRRALIVMPLAAAGWFAFLRRPERSLPDASIDGSGPLVSLILFSDDGTPIQQVALHKIIKTDRAWRAELSSEEFAVTRRQATEFAFANRYWNEHAAGMYRCVCCGTALFDSSAKFDSGTGWPSFTQPLAFENIETRPDHSLAETRTEVLCRKCDAHLGHVFDDGPPPTGKRYCLNSAALRLVPLKP